MTDPLTIRFPSVTFDTATGSYVLPLSIALEVANYLRDDAAYRLDMATNVAGVDWLPQVIKKKVKTSVTNAEGVVEQVESEVSENKPGLMEVVYHLISVEKRKGPLVIRLQTTRENPVVPSLTPVWRGCEFQEREAFDLYGIVFEGHPDLRRIFMWDEFKDFPMRKDYVESDDYEYEPTPHDAVLEKAQKHYPNQT
ncbi:MAG: NADH-quinone oxidoreductase subunit C [Verrucomicrobiota bacterium]|nr:NADH-quinone oxidoreductase subunit C [Verrucomicrobiota bacterium]